MIDRLCYRNITGALNLRSGSLLKGASPVDFTVMVPAEPVLSEPHLNIYKFFRRSVFNMVSTVILADFFYEC